jgi:hypothetical protein
MKNTLGEKKQRMEAAGLRAGILEGYQDAIAGRTTEFSGDLKKDMARFKKCKKK